MVTRGKRWSNSAGSGWPQGLKSGGPSLGRSPGAHKQRRPVNQDQIQIFGEIGSTQFSEQGFSPCSFFFEMRLFSMSGFKVSWFKISGENLPRCCVRDE